MLLLKRIQQFLRDESGPTAVEYGVMLALILIVCLSAITSVGNQVSASFNNTSNEIQNAVGS